MLSKAFCAAAVIATASSAVASQRCELAAVVAGGAVAALRSRGISRDVATCAAAAQATSDPKASTPAATATSAELKDSGSAADTGYSGAARALNRSFKEIEQMAENIYRSCGELWQPAYGISVLGGQVMGQAMAAAARTASPGLTLHSAHAYFIRPAARETPITYHVERLKDGNVFNTRSVIAKQKDRPVLSLMASYHGQEDDRLFSYQLPAPKVPHHTQLPLLHLPSFYEERKHKLNRQEDIFIRGFLRDNMPLDLKPIDPDGYFALRPVSRRTYWAKARDRLDNDRSTHQGVILSAADIVMLECGFSRSPSSFFHHEDALLSSSLDQVIWFHTPDVRADEWLLYDGGEDNTGGNRSCLTGHIWTSEGKLVATFAQEGLLRIIKGARLKKA